MTLVDEIKESSGAGDEDIDAAPERVDLRALSHAAEDEGVPLGTMAWLLVSDQLRKRQARRNGGGRR